MANSIKLEVITPEKLFYSGEIELVIVRTLQGDEGFMAGHAWACKLLDIGELWIQEKGKSKTEFKVAAIAGGFIDVKENIVLYTDAAEWSENIDKDRALSAKTKAEDWLAAQTGRDSGQRDINQITQAKIDIAKAITRMNVAEGGARRKR